MYGVRRCRGHWHITVGDGPDSTDIMVLGDPFKTAEEAQAIADKRNAGISWEEIESSAAPDAGSPNWNSPVIKALRERDYERINDPRMKKLPPEDSK
jgi:hypothetical protein